jgi:hypothetical protein
MDAVANSGLQFCAGEQAQSNTGVSKTKNCEAPKAMPTRNQYSLMAQVFSSALGSKLTQHWRVED